MGNSKGGATARGELDIIRHKATDDTQPATAARATGLRIEIEKGFQPSADEAAQDLVRVLDDHPDAPGESVVLFSGTAARAKRLMKALTEHFNK